jgi:hypothetical protein
LTGGFGVAVCEGNAAILQYLYDCTLHSPSRNLNNIFEDRPFSDVQKFNEFGFIAAQKNHASVLKKLAKFMLTQTENFEFVFHQNLFTLTKSADGEPDLYYFGTYIGNWRQLVNSDYKSYILHGVDCNLRFCV